MILALDVQYDELAATTGVVGFEAWGDTASALEMVARSDVAPAPYEPGEFYKRELPYLTQVVVQLREVVDVEVVVIDGHVWLTAQRQGLGAHLYAEMDQQIAVVGVAKNEFRDGVGIPVFRGESRQALYVSAEGFDPVDAARCVREMDGEYRLPTLLKLADQLARGLVEPAADKGPPVSCAANRER